MKKRVLSLMLALMMVIAVLPVVSVKAAIPHPFAAALRDYMEGNIEVWNAYYDVRISSEVRMAQLVTLDDAGTMGVLLTIDDGFVSRVLLYMYNDELFYSLQGWSHHGAFGAGRYNRLMSAMGGDGRVYTLESGRLVISSSWWDGTYYDGILRFNGQVVTEAEFDMLLARYGFDGTWGDRFGIDQTAQILAMTVNDTVVTAQSNAISVTINGTAVNFTDQQPTIIDGRTLVPIRGVFEALGFEVSWNQQARQATLSRAGDTIIITIDSATFTANGVSHTLDVPAQLIDGSTMLPVRAVLEAVGYSLDWNGYTQTVIISTN